MFYKKRYKVVLMAIFLNVSLCLQKNGMWSKDHSCGDSATNIHIRMDHAHVSVMQNLSEKMIALLSKFTQRETEKIRFISDFTERPHTMQDSAILADVPKISDKRLAHITQDGRKYIVSGRRAWVHCSDHPREGQGCSHKGGRRAVQTGTYIQKYHHFLKC